MATALTADVMLAALKRWGIAPKFYKPDWRTHNRNEAQGWGPLYGFIVHNFASDISDASSLAYLYNGDAGRSLPGPLSQFAITDDGQVWVIGWGTANHAGTVDSDTHALVIKDAMPRDRDVRPNTSGASTSGTVKGGPRYIGVEMTYGNKGPTPAQRASCVRLAAAMAEMVGGTGGSVVGHRECTTSRSDPQFIPMGPFRREVDALVKAGPGITADGPTTPVPATQEDDIMAMTPAERAALINDIATGVWEKKLPNHDPNPSDNVTPTAYAARSYVVMASWRTASLSGQVAGLSAALTQLAAGQDVDLDAVMAAAKSGAEAALEERITSADVTLNVDPT